MKALCLISLAACFASAELGAEESMRCGTRLISEGDPQAKVVKICGKPTQTETRTILRAGIPRQDIRVGVRLAASRSHDELLVHDRSLVEIEVEVWLYNRGPSRLMREVVFRDNRILAVNLLGRGF
jgi:hypothetical protein